MSSCSSPPRRTCSGAPPPVRPPPAPPERRPAAGAPRRRTVILQRMPFCPSFWNQLRRPNAFTTSGQRKRDHRQEQLCWLAAEGRFCVCEAPGGKRRAAKRHAACGGGEEVCRSVSTTRAFQQVVAATGGCTAGPRQRRRQEPRSAGEWGRRGGGRTWGLDGAAVQSGATRCTRWMGGDARACVSIESALQPQPAAMQQDVAAAARRERGKRARTILGTHVIYLLRQLSARGGPAWGGGLVGSRGRRTWGTAVGWR